MPVLRKHAFLKLQISNQYYHSNYVFMVSLKVSAPGFRSGVADCRFGSSEELVFKAMPGQIATLGYCCVMDGKSNIGGGILT